MATINWGSDPQKNLVAVIKRIYQDPDELTNAIDPLQVTYIQFDKEYAKPATAGKELEEYLTEHAKSVEQSKDTSSPQSKDARTIAFDIMQTQIEINDAVEAIPKNFWFQILVQLMAPCVNLETIEWPRTWYGAYLGRLGPKYDKFPKIDLTVPRQQKRPSPDEEYYWRIGVDRPE